MNRWLILSLACLATAGAARAHAHCDTLDGPVVQAAAEALATGEVDLVLVWVQEDDEAAVREAFGHVRAVRDLGPEAQALADKYFFELVVRLHRAGEGEPFTGLQPAGADLGPALVAADSAVATGEATAVRELLASALDAGLAARFQAIVETREYAAGDVAAGRRFVQSYVAWIHYVEGLYQAITAAGPHDEHGAQPAHVD